MKRFFSFSGFVQSPSPLIVAACAAIPVVYSSLPALRISLLVFTAILLAGSLLWYAATVLKKPLSFLCTLSLFQNSVSFGTSFGKIGLLADFSHKSKVAVPKTEILEQPQVKNQGFSVGGGYEKTTC